MKEELVYNLAVIKRELRIHLISIEALIEVTHNSRLAEARMRLIECIQLFNEVSI